MPLAQGNRKVCSSCRRILPLSSYRRNRALKDGLSNQCKVCSKASNDKWIAKDPEGRREYQRMWNFKSRYRLTPEQYQELLQRVDGKCQVCGAPPVEGGRLDVDHDHVTKLVRGLLCHPCNLALGAVKDNPARLRALANYLEAHAALELPAE